MIDGQWLVKPSVAGFYHAILYVLQDVEDSQYPLESPSLCPPPAEGGYQVVPEPSEGNIPEDVQMRPGNSILSNSICSGYALTVVCYYVKLLYNDILV